MSSAPYWAATQLQAHRERVAEYFLKQFGFDVYLPRIRQNGVRFGRRVEYLMPLFPGYCFTRIELQWHNVRQCPGVVRLVRARGHDEPAHVPDKVISALRARERNGAIDLPKPGRRTLRIGDRVRIGSGLCAGQSGLCVRVSSRHVNVILLMLGAQRQVQLSRDAVELA